MRLGLILAIAATLMLVSCRSKSAGMTTGDGITAESNSEAFPADVNAALAQGNATAR